MDRTEINMPQIGNANSHRLLKIAEQLVAVAAHIGAGGAAASQDDSRIAAIGVRRGHLTHLLLLRIPIVAIEQTHNEPVQPAECGNYRDGQQAMHHGQRAQQW